MNLIVKDYPELSEWFETPKTTDSWTVQVEVPVVGQPKLQMTETIQNEELGTNSTRQISVQKNKSTEKESINSRQTMNYHSVIQKTGPEHLPIINRADANMNINLATTMTDPDSPTVNNTIIINNTTADGGHNTVLDGPNSPQFTSFYGGHIIQQGPNSQNNARLVQQQQGPDAQIEVDLDDFLDSLEAEEINERLNVYKSSHGCTWDASSGGGCGEDCAFVRTMLKLDEINHNMAHTKVPRTQKVTIVRQTAEGFVKVTETQAAFHSQQNVQFIKLPQANQLIKKNCESFVSNGGGIIQLQPVYFTNAPVNSAFAVKAQAVKLESRPIVTGIYLPSAVQPGSIDGQKSCISLGSAPTLHSYAIPAGIPSPVMGATSPSLPTPSPSPPAEDLIDLTAAAAGLTDAPGPIIFCPTCNTKFRDQKQLVKHKRNHHQAYVCKECGTCVEGYYQMASHSKREHQKEPIYFCECGRNFGEKKGMTKHQNTCRVFKGGVSEVK